MATVIPTYKCCAHYTVGANRADYYSRDGKITISSTAFDFDHSGRMIGLCGVRDPAELWARHKLIINNNAAAALADVAAAARR